MLLISTYSGVIQVLLIHLLKEETTEQVSVREMVVSFYLGLIKARQISLGKYHKCSDTVFKGQTHIAYMP